MQIAAPPHAPSQSPTSPLAAGVGTVAFSDADANVGFLLAGDELAHLGMLRFLPRDAPAGIAAGEQVRFAVDLLSRDDKGYHVAIHLARP